MLTLIRKGRLSTLLALILVAMSSSLMSQCCEPCSCNRLYVGAFGGGICSSKSVKAHQYGTAYFPETSPPFIGPLPIIAEGHLNKTKGGFGGGQIGYEWSNPCCSDWSFSPAVELEAFFFNHKKSGHFMNQTLVGLPEHDFLDCFSMNSTLILANTVVSINSPCMCGFSPYVGGGIGAARVSLHKASSLQILPVEPDVNHFNSNRKDSTWAFAAQVKAGVRYNFCQMFHVFAEYRYVFIDSSNFIFGSTNYSNHVPTSPWNFKVKDTNYNAFAVGIQVDLY